MAVFEKKSTINATQKELFNWHIRPGAFRRLSPPWENIRVIKDPGPLAEGSVMVMELKKGPLPLRWTALHKDFEKNRGFTEEQVKGPFKSWKHVHRFGPSGKGSVLADRVEYELPLGFPGKLVAGRFIEKELERMFNFRHQRIKNDLERHATFMEATPLKVVISGAGGIIGGALSAFLITGGHRVTRLVRRDKGLAEDERFWDPVAGRLDPEVLNGADAVINLSGESLTDSKWTKEKRERILQSRVDSTDLLAKTMSEMDAPPALFMSASAVGYYGDCPDEMICSETTPAGDGFLPEVCSAWEEAACRVVDAGVRPVQLRIGVVMTPAGGALGQMLLPFKLGLGGTAGPGKQTVSWVALDDVVYTIFHLLHETDMEGPVNLSSPKPVTNRELTKTLAKVLKRPAILPIPSALVKTIYGEMGETLLLKGARAEPKALLSSGYDFQFPDLEDTLRFELGRQI